VVQASLAVIGIPTRVLASEDLSAYVMAENDDTGKVKLCDITHNICFALYTVT
jgi:hypothetical protein